MSNINGKISKESSYLPLEIPMYDCSKIKRLTVLYTSSGPGTYAGERRKILGEEESFSICQEANRRQMSIEMLLKSREHIEAVVINTVIPFEQPVKAEIPDSAKKARNGAVEQEKKEEQPAPGSEHKIIQASEKEEEQKPQASL